MQVWDRQAQRLIDVPEVGGGAIRFTYGTVPGRLLAKAFLCRKPVSALYAAWQRSRLSRGKVRRFMQTYHISADDCTTQEFSCFNDFFTRQRKHYVNQTVPDELPAVADSKLTALPISAEQRFAVKGVPYTVAELLDDAQTAKRYEGGWCLIFRLAPDDYHRYVYPDAGTQSATRAVPGVLHTVNPIAADLKVYRRNARRWTVLQTAHFGQVVQMEVGALLVGRIRNHCETPASFEKLQEKGYFEYGGSTVILLLPPDRFEPDADILSHSAQGIESKVRLGERIGTARSGTVKRKK